ncbi:NUDIX hydrolase [Aestuariibius sp. HNIBRBA575]|uniref:NUDIX hydrolase n=1 Tax=Aestuariibius sp. HNIBRBA575 TaxID=3233343 RepID=UPI0034A32B06
MTHWPKLAAIAVVVQGDHVLLVRRKNPPDAGLWGYPGGHVDPGETALAAAMREVAEETGVTVRAGGYLTNLDIIGHHPDGTLEYHYLLAAVHCDYVSGTPQAADDVSDAAWMPLSQVLDGNLNMSADVANVLQMAIAARA